MCFACVLCLLAMLIIIKDLLSESFYNKHMRRVTWCKNNIDDIIKHYNLKKTKWKIDYCFIVNNPLVSNKALKINIKHTL